MFPNAVYKLNVVVAARMIFNIYISLISTPEKKKKKTIIWIKIKFLL